MSDMAEKLAATAQPGGDNKARAHLGHLRARWGKIVVLEGEEKAPKLLELHSMGSVERWRSIGKRDGNLWFEKEG